MHNTLEERDRPFVQTLQRLGSGSVRELCEVLDVTATSVRQRLARLGSIGIVSHEEVSSGRGRPVKRYSLTNAGLRELGKDYSDLAVILWSELSSIEHQPTKERVFAGIRSKMISKHQQASASVALETRVTGLASELEQAGLDVGVDLTGQLPILKGHACPYPDIARTDSSICQLETEVFAEVLDSNVELTSRCVDGHTCCDFVISEKSAAAETNG